MSLALVALLVIAYWLAIFWIANRIGSFLAGPRQMKAPPARPKQRRVDIDLSDIEWDWKRAA